MDKKYLSKRNVAIAFGTIGLCSSVGYGMPTSSSDIAAQLANAMSAARSHGGHHNVTVTNTGSSPASSSSNSSNPAQPSLNTAAFSLGAKPYKGAIALDPAAKAAQEAQIRTAAQNATMNPAQGSAMSSALGASALIKACADESNQNGTGAFDDSCLLHANQPRSGLMFYSMTSPFAAPVSGTNWNAASLTVPYAFEGSDRQKQMMDDLKSIGQVPDSLASLYNNSDYYSNWSAVTDSIEKNMGSPMPAMQFLWGDGKSSSVKIDGVGTVTFQAGAAG